MIKTAKIAQNLPQTYSKLKNLHIITVNINLNAFSVTQILMVYYSTSNWDYTVEVAFTVIFT